MPRWITLVGLQTIVCLANIRAMPRREAVKLWKPATSPGFALPDRVKRGAIETMTVTEVNPEVNMNVTQLITSKGYPCENYWLTTKDGYILNMQRIPHRPFEEHVKKDRPVALLLHGLFTSSAIYLLNRVKSSLGFLLADAGVDVWLGNSRGNIYSTNHTTLDPKQAAFWDFSWDEMAKYDLPAMVEFIINKTGQKQIYYVGYSQGTTIGFAAFSQNADLASKIRHFIALAPVGRVGKITSALRSLLPYISHVKRFFYLIGHGGIDISRDLSHNLASHVGHPLDQRLCEKLAYLLFGFNPSSFNRSRFDIYLAQMPAGTSVRNLLHWAQAAKDGEFQHFNWGTPEANLEKYGQTSPPQYYPRQIKLPIAIFRGGHDTLADPEDIDWLLPQINVTHDISVEYFNHLDFVTGMDAPDKIYKQVISIVANTSVEVRNN
ncbi:lipase [Plakobranchus ocellatus]|uniref:Lipase n=1 Tax=Plakobranchus ocellatus TaxID=259542 RepID=A0AAV4D1V3_9GAST|nr:lipase [Plakobranchus ocellatus]